ncbi:MAG: 2-oxoglutarate dehydrogenase E1 component [Candidatus Sulfomarinibacteraceae bacterium]
MAQPSSKSGPDNLALLSSPDYVDEMYRRWKDDPASLSEQWRSFFAGFDLAAGSDSMSSDEAADQSKVAGLIFAYRNVGHLIADVNPLDDSEKHDPIFDLETYELSEKHLDRVYDTGHLGGPKRITLRELIRYLRDCYCRKIGVEYLHIQDMKVRRWLQGKMEPVLNKPEVANEKKRRILDWLVNAEVFESFLNTRYQGQKRFSLEGVESVIPALHELMDAASDTGAEEVVMGMSHRGRLNVLVNILDKPLDMVFHEFEDNLRTTDYADGDVKYHRGYSSDYTVTSGKTLHISLTANPSHLEAVDPVVEGRARAKQRRRNDTEHRTKVIPVLLHGDAAFAGQGLVAETLNLSQLPGYRTGGTVHIIVNNQIGFTTTAVEARSSRYPTDVAKLVEAPILHVNGDDPEAVVWAIELAVRFRQEFHRDVVVDIIGYRRWGHNEGDEPAFTQPLMYQKIANRPNVRELYQLQLEGEHAITLDESAHYRDEFQSLLIDKHRKAQESCPVPMDDKHAFHELWTGLNNPYTFDPGDTAVSESSLDEVATALSTIPDGFELNRKVARRLPKVKEIVEERGLVDWPLAELLAFGTLLQEGLPVRLSGQDSVRGTFSQRHAAWYDTHTQERYVPLNHISDDQARFCAYNSMLSEAAVLGFDYGYSLVEPNMLVLWEAQFGDFANGAQVIIDQFITPALDKWQRGSGIVMLLPHGYEGQGPEHSNAYLERYLTLCAEENIQVCNLTTPAQYFHALRRQLKRDLRRPLIIMAPKSLLRSPKCVSPVSELTDGHFHEILADPSPPKKTRRLVLCSGKIYYDLIAAREESGVKDVAIVRVEQFYPFNEKLFHEVTERHRKADEIAWVQEETENRGGWGFMMPHLLDAFPDRRPRYIGRGPSASPATGSPRVHREQQRSIVESALGA